MLDTTDHSRALWLGPALLLSGVLLFVVYAFVGTFVLGLFLYYAARPIYDRVRRRTGRSSLAAALALVVLVLPVVGLFGYTVALAVAELRSLSAVDPSAYGELLAPYLDVADLTGEFESLLGPLLEDPGRLLSESGLRRTATGLVATTASYLGVILAGLLRLFVALALAFYLLRDGDRLAAWVGRTAENETLAAYGRAVDGDLETVFFGNILNALLTGVIGAIVFSALAALAPTAVPVPVPVLLGLLAGAGSLVPVVGMKVVYVPVSLYLGALAVIAGSQLLWFPVVFFLVAFTVVDTIPDLVVRPYVSGRNLHVGAVMLAYILGPLLFGWYGLFLGPLLLVLITDFAGVVVPVVTGTGPGTATPASDGAAGSPDGEAVPSPADDESVDGSGDGGA